MLKFSHQKDLRKGRFSQQNQIYHITFTTRNRMPVFSGLINARILINILRQCDQLGYTSTQAFVVMPDHVHWLMQLTGGKMLANLIKTVKSKVTIQIGSSIWQSGYYDHALRKDEDVQTIARYIVANPLRAGLVNKIGEYAHWDAIWL